MLQAHKSICYKDAEGIQMSLYYYNIVLLLVFIFCFAALNQDARSAIMNHSMGITTHTCPTYLPSIAILKKQGKHAPETFFLCRSQNK